MTGRIEKTVFISYRRTNFPWARAIYKELHHEGYDVFFDFLSLNSGDFEKVILENIRARAHFIVILTPSALERCHEPRDWLRREIEIAIDSKRNIVPLMVESFDFGSPATIKALSGKLADLKKYGALGIPVEYFDAAMVKLRERYLDIPLESVLHPVSDFTRQATEEQKTAASEAPQVEEEELTAQEWFERGYKHDEAKNYRESIRCYTEAIKLSPNYAVAYGNRGYAILESNGKLTQALSDLNRAIKLTPDDHISYNNRGRVYHHQGKPAKALADYDLSIKYNPNYHHPYINRGVIRKDQGDLDGAIKDHSKAISLNPDFADAYINRSNALSAKGDLDAAIKDNNKAIRIDPNADIAYYNRANDWEDKKRYKAAIADYQKYLDLGGGIRDGDQKEIEEKIKALKSKLTKKKSTKKKTK